MEMPDFLSLNEKEYAILGLLGKGKGGYTWLAERDGVELRALGCTLLVPDGRI